MGIGCRESGSGGTQSVMSARPRNAALFTVRKRRPSWQNRESETSSVRNVIRGMGSRELRMRLMIEKNDAFGVSAGHHVVEGLGKLAEVIAACD